MAYKRIPEKLKKKRGPKGPSKYDQEFIEKEAIALEKYAQDSPLPFLNKFAVDRGYYPQVITDGKWGQNKKFYDALKKAKALLEYKLTVGTLAGKLNPAMAIFALKNVAGWRDKQEIAHTIPEHLFEKLKSLDNADLIKKARELTSRLSGSLSRN